MKHTLTSNCILVTLLLFSIFPALVSAANPDGVSGGWVNYPTIDRGVSAKCTGTTGEYSFRLYEFNTMTQLTNAQAHDLTLTVRRYSESSGSIVESVSVTGQSASATICYDPANESVWPRVTHANNDADYYEFDAVGFGAYGSGAWRSRHIQGSVHLRVRSATPVAEAIYPINEFIRDLTPTFEWGINAVNTQHNATAGRVSALWSWNDANRAGTYSGTGWFSDTANAGVRSRSISRTFTDGTWGWIFAHVRNGGDSCLDGLCMTINNGRPELGISRVAKFVIDTTDPTSSVTVTKAAVSGQSVLTFENTVRDVTSGLRLTRLYITKIAPTVGSENTIQTNFTVGSGIAGGPNNTLFVDVPVTVESGATYSYYFRTVDAAGNYVESPVRTVVAAVVPPNATITGTGCTIPLGASTCNGTLTWDINNVTSPNVYNQTRSAQYSTAPTANGFSALLVQGSNTVQARNGSTVLDSVNISGTCAVGTVWNGSLCSLPPPTVSITASQSVVRYGDTVGLRIEIFAPYATVCTIDKDVDGDPTYLIPANEITEFNFRSNPLYSLTTFGLSCENIVDPSLQSHDSVTVKVVATFIET